MIDSEAGAAVRRPSLTQIVGILLVAQIYIGLAVNCAGVYAPVVTRSLGLPTQAIGIFMGFVAGTGMFSGFFLDGTVHRYGPLRAMQLAVLTSTLGFGAASSGLPALVLLGAMLIGTSMGVSMPASTQLLAMAGPKERLGLLFSIKQSGVPIAVGLSGVVVPALLYVMSWQMSLFVLFAVGAAVIAVMQPLRAALDAGRRPGAPFRSGSLLGPLVLVAKSAGLRTLALAVFLLGIVQGCVVGFVVSFLNFDAHLSLATAGLALAVSQVAAVLARLLTGWWADRIGDPLAVLAGIAGGAALTVFAISRIAPGWPVAAVFAIVTVCGATAFCWTGLYAAGLVKYVDLERIPAAAVGTQFFMFLGGVAGPLMFAGVTRASGSLAAGFVAAAAVAAIAAAWVTVSRVVIGKPAP